MSESVRVTVRPDCDIHKYHHNTPGVPAVVDGKTIHGPWANMCADCFGSNGIGLGTGKGQMLLLDDPAAV